MNLVHLPATEPNDQIIQLSLLLSALRQRGFDPIWDVQVLCMRNDTTPVSRRPLNETIQTQLNPVADGVPEERRHATYRPGDKVICLKNTEVKEWRPRDAEGYAAADPRAIGSYVGTGNVLYVANGDMGRVLAVEPSSVIVQFLLPDRITRVYTKRRKAVDDRDLDGAEAAKEAEFDLAYAVTIHKFQGSQIPVAIIILDEQAGPLGCRELIYTAISRAERLCFLVGKLPTAWKWAAKKTLERRKTFLVDMIRGTP